MEALGRALARAEEALRADGLTGAQAFDALMAGLSERLGLGGDPDDAARAAARDVPIDPNGDWLGLAYERFFPDLFKGRKGQFFTPRPLAELLVARVGLQPGEDVLDPTCGSGGLLLEAARHGAKVRGIEIDPRLAQLARIGLGLAGAGGAVRCTDFFAADREPADVVLANPPFSVVLSDPAVLEKYDSGRGRSQVVSDQLFVEALQRWVRPGGRAAVVLPFSVLTNARYAGVRDRIRTHWEHLATCALPEGVFRPFGGAAGRAVLLWLRRSASTTVAPMWAALRDPGYDVRLQRLKRTSGAEVERLKAGEGWTRLAPPGWTPAPGRGAGRPVRQLAVAHSERVVPTGLDPVWVADLADAARSTGEVAPRSVAGEAVGGARVRLQTDDVLVARLRPGLGNVALAPPTDGSLIGSPEWIVLRPCGRPGWLLLALRSPTWRATLPVTGGQTRPRTTREAVLDSKIAWPGSAVADRAGALAERLHTERRALGDRLAALQAAVDAFAAGVLDRDALDASVARLEEQQPDVGEGADR